jgi:hypothetical protein
MIMGIQIFNFVVVVQLLVIIIVLTFMLFVNLAISDSIEDMLKELESKNKKGW